MQAGDTLASIARLYGVTEAELREANCLELSATLATGQNIYVPGPVGEGATGVTITPGHGLQVVGCTNPAIRITNLQPGQRIRGITTIFGTASPQNFQYYQLEVRPDIAATYDFLLRSDERVSGGPLGLLNAAGLRTGVYWIRLSVVNRAGAIDAESCAIPVFVE